MVFDQSNLHILFRCSATCLCCCLHALLANMRCGICLSTLQVYQPHGYDGITIKGSSKTAVQGSLFINGMFYGHSAASQISCQCDAMPKAVIVYISWVECALPQRYTSSSSRSGSVQFYLVNSLLLCGLAMKTWMKR